MEARLWKTCEILTKNLSKGAEQKVTALYGIERKKSWVVLVNRPACSIV